MNLPENYIVICETQEETNEVISFVGKIKTKSWGFWNFVMVSNNERNISFIEENVKNWFQNKNIPYYKTFTFKEWKKMKKSKTFPQYWYIKVTEETLDAINKVRAKQKENKEPITLGEYQIYFRDINNYNQGGGLIHVTAKHVELTLDEFKFYFLEEEFIKKQQSNRMKLTVSVNEVLEIHKIACSSWKSKIANYLTRVDSNQNVTFNQSEIDEMFKAATIEQKPVLTKIFGELVKPIEWDKIKTGSKVMIKSTGSIIINYEDELDFSEYFDIVFWKTKHSIDSTNVFLNTCLYKSYCTLSQKGNFVRFNTENNTDFIIKVIEY